MCVGVSCFALPLGQRPKTLLDRRASPTTQIREKGKLEDYIQEWRSYKYKSKRTPQEFTNIIPGPKTKICATDQQVIPKYLLEFLGQETEQKWRKWKD